MDVGIILSGSFAEVYVRQHSGYQAEIGELLVAQSDQGDILYQVIELSYASQIASQQLELIAGMRLEDQQEIKFFDDELRNYVIITAKPILLLAGAKPAKVLPRFFSVVRQVTNEDLRFLIQDKHSLKLGSIRNGSRAMDLQVSLDGPQVLSHHVLVSATTGKGKSNLLSTVLFNHVGAHDATFLVFDPHDEYYGRSSLGLKDHPLAKDQVRYYTMDTRAGGTSLRLPVSSVLPHHLTSVLSLSQAQVDTVYVYYRELGTDWIKKLLDTSEPLLQNVREESVAVLRRKISRLLNVTNDGKQASGIFTLDSKTKMIDTMLEDVLACRTVVVDTSQLTGQAELLVSSIIVYNLYDHYRQNFRSDDTMPVVSIVLEEAPRVIGKDVLEHGNNIFGTIAREGRKFGVGLFAITQLPSLIPRDILANMNTKIIMGTEMAVERQALVESAAQDLSKDHRSIASLDKGEAIISSNFARFALPVMLPLFKDVVVRTQNSMNAKQYKSVVTGLKPLFLKTFK